jgi:hypothetical protein
MGFAAATITSLARLFVPEMIDDISFAGLFKRDQQRLKFFGVQPCKGAHNAWFLFEGMIGGSSP